MQNIFNNTSVIAPIATKSITLIFPSTAKLMKTMKHRMDLISVLTLLISAGSYCAFSLMRLA